MKKFPNLEYEQKYWQQNKKVVIGIDEVGRGPLAGPVVAGAVAFAPDHQMIEGINDSKKLSAKKRELFAQQIKAQAQAWAIGVGSIKLINDQGIMPAILFAMTSAIEQVGKFDKLLIDGLPIKQPFNHRAINPSNIEYIVKGDAKSYSIAAASIIAKVYRDQLMTNLAKEFEHYGWEKNMGYGTLQHRQALQEHGATIFHRKKFIEKIIND